jgi:hypothetical protein
MPGNGSFRYDHWASHHQFATLEARGEIDIIAFLRRVALTTMKAFLQKFPFEKLPENFAAHNLHKAVGS